MVPLRPSRHFLLRFATQPSLFVLPRRRDAERAGRHVLVIVEPAAT